MLQYSANFNNFSDFKGIDHRLAEEAALHLIGAEEVRYYVIKARVIFAYVINRKSTT
jgi:hypothetical protein